MPVQIIFIVVQATLDGVISRTGDETPMINALHGLIHKFFGEMNMTGSLSRFSALLSGAILIFAVLSCLFGYKLFRFISAAVAFLLTAIGISLLLGPTASRAVVVTAFIIIGILAAFLAYQWTEFGAFILCASIGFGFASLITDILWVQLLIALFPGAISIRFPVMSIILATAIWGGVTLGIDGSEAAGFGQIPFQIMMSIGLSLLGIEIQYATNKEPVREELSFMKKLSGKRRASVIKTPRKGGATEE